MGNIASLWRKIPQCDCASLYIQKSISYFVYRHYLRHCCTFTSESLIVEEKYKKRWICSASSQRFCWVVGRRETERQKAEDDWTQDITASGKDNPQLSFLPGYTISLPKSKKHQQKVLIFNNDTVYFASIVYVTLSLLMQGTDGGQPVHSNRSYYRRSET